MNDPDKKDPGARLADPTGQRARNEAEEERKRRVVRDLVNKNFSPDRIVQFEHVRRLGLTLDDVKRYGCSI
jgi:hypothetical protein